MYWQITAQVHTYKSQHKTILVDWKWLKPSWHMCLNMKASILRYCLLLMQLLLGLLLQYWNGGAILLLYIGSAFGYFPNSSKTFLIVKAESLFADTYMNVTV